MTDIRLGGLGREALVADTGIVRVSTVASEALLSGATPALLMGLAREALLLSPPVILGGQTAVTINTG